jgi:lipoprotein-anchoring transpeptidase ErfK/SrfK
VKRKIPFAVSVIAAVLSTGALGGQVAPQEGPPLTEADRATLRAYSEKEAMALQITLDKEGFSPGEIDGKLGKNTLRALEAYEGARGTKAKPAANGGLRNYEISAEDTEGPFTEIPSDMMAQSKLERLGYSSILEKLGEQFHIAPELLRKINPGKKFAAGVTIKVPDVDSSLIPDSRQGEQPSNAGFGQVTIFVSKSRSSLQVLDSSGDVVFRGPVTTGSEKDPLPIGEWAVNSVTRNPVFHYNPDLFWDANPEHAQAKIPPGPNNPVGAVWIDLTKEHYGIHGTPAPGRISYSESHGCIRMTNWDALRVAALVTRGTPVHLIE